VVSFAGENFREFRVSVAIRESFNREINLESVPQPLSSGFALGLGQFMDHKFLATVVYLLLITHLAGFKCFNVGMRMMQ